MSFSVGGIIVHKAALDRAAQAQLLEEVRAVVRAAPLFRPETRRGQKMSVQMTSAGEYGWISDRQGYRYEKAHPSGSPWPAIPETAARIWAELSGVTRPAQSCLINFYQANARMGLHQDRDEADFDMPVVSISLGDDALFRVGGAERSDPTQSIWLNSGDVAVMGGEARLNHHGVDKIRPSSSALLKDGGRINLTLRVVD